VFVIYRPIRRCFEIFEAPKLGSLSSPDSLDVKAVVNETWGSIIVSYRTVVSWGRLLHPKCARESCLVSACVAKMTKFHLWESQWHTFGWTTNYMKNLNHMSICIVRRIGFTNLADSLEIFFSKGFAFWSTTLPSIERLGFWHTNLLDDILTTVGNVSSIWLQYWYSLGKTKKNYFHFFFAPKGMERQI
jgi:hypothetical protein